MKVLTAKVVDGRLDLPDGTLHDGETVTLLIPESDQGFTLEPDEKSRLLEAIAQAERGEGRDGWELLSELQG